MAIYSFMSYFLHYFLYTVPWAFAQWHILLPALGVPHVLLAAKSTSVRLCSLGHFFQVLGLAYRGSVFASGCGWGLCQDLPW